MKTFATNLYSRIAMTAFCTLIGGVVGHQSLDYGVKGLLTGMGVLLGFALGGFFAILWTLFLRLNGE